MMIALHKQARTMPRIRAEIAASEEPVSALMQRYGVTAATVRKWQHRTAFHDRSHTARRLQTRLKPGAGGYRGLPTHRAAAAAG